MIKLCWCLNRTICPHKCCNGVRVCQWGSKNYWKMECESYFAIAMNLVTYKHIHDGVDIFNHFL